jgi:23S rRNA (cytosine1962-C5)-methyltransferase
LKAPPAVVGPRGRTRIAARHPWVFRQDIVRGPATDASDGGPALVQVTDARGQPLGLATWAARAPIALRMLTFGAPGDGPPDPRAGAGQHRGLFLETPAAPGQEPPALLDLVAKRLGPALARRGGLARERDALRLVHGESDGLPGLFVDRYADAVVVQTTSVAMDAAQPAIAGLLAERLSPRIVLERNDGSARDFELLPRRAGVLRGEGPTRVVYQLGPNQLEADLLVDGKTGGFLDQADNHARVAELAPAGARALDAFTYHGGFALALARLGGAVLATDEDEQAVTRARANAARNDLANLEVRRANAFDLLRTLEGAGERFEVVVLDPPALAKRKSEAGAAQRAYKELVLRGLRLTAPAGLTVACSCSGRISRADWDEIVAAAAADAGRQVQVIERLGAGRDHPELVGVPETGHLKCWILRVL